MKIFEGQYNFQDELDRSIPREDHAEKPVNEITEDTKKDGAAKIIKDDKYYADLAEKHCQEIIARLKKTDQEKLVDPNMIDYTGRDISDSDAYQIHGHYKQFKDENLRGIVRSLRG